ncbi:unnamed protein product [Prunus armeniaca]|uniref:Uncharacterized protein n=1 Tax=Prunus armeniaca TaxID=36596 RepID=A0A6J5U9D6_PRUAR|nr:unnamed protein product [Prunus armeniaca]
MMVADKDWFYVKGFGDLLVLDISKLLASSSSSKSPRPEFKRVHGSSHLERRNLPRGMAYIIVDSKLYYGGWRLCNSKRTFPMASAPKVNPLVVTLKDKLYPCSVNESSLPVLPNMVLTSLSWEMTWEVIFSQISYVNQMGPMSCPQSIKDVVAFHLDLKGIPKMVGQLFELQKVLCPFLACSSNFISHMSVVFQLLVTSLAGGDQFLVNAHIKAFESYYFKELGDPVSSQLLLVVPYEGLSFLKTTSTIDYYAFRSMLLASLFPRSDTPLLSKLTLPKRASTDRLGRADKHDNKADVSCKKENLPEFDRRGKEGAQSKPTSPLPQVDSSAAAAHR